MAPASKASGRFDLVVASDMTLGGDIGLRIATEAQVAAAQGMRTGFLHVSATRRGRISADVQGALRRGWAEAVDLGAGVETGLLVVHAPHDIKHLPPGLRGMVAGTVVLVQDRVPETKHLMQWLPLARGPMLWAPTNRWVRAAIEKLDMPVPMEAADWRPSVGQPEWPTRTPGTRLQLGMVVQAGSDAAPDLQEHLAALLPDAAQVDIHLFGMVASDLAKSLKLRASVTVHAATDIDMARFLALVDVLACFPSEPGEAMPEAAIGLAMAMGRVVAMPPPFRPHFGPSLLYCAAHEIVEQAVTLLRDPAVASAAREKTLTEAPLQFSRSAHAERLTRLARCKPTARSVRPRKSRPSILFVPSNGVGLGHVSRLLAIANRLQRDCDTAFATLAQAASIIDGFGHIAHYLPSLSDTGAEKEDWDAWFRLELERLIDLHDADLVVFDGNTPTPGLVHAALSRPPCRLAWVRRGMSKAASPNLHLSGRFDLIIEPGELADAYDHGATAARRHEVKRVPPIRLLDVKDLLPRATARAELGLDQSQPAALIQLGAGAHRNVVEMTDAAVRALQGLDGVQIIIAEWENSVVPLSFWPGTKVLSGFPLSRFAHAFDFSISAAGYNSFHEAIEFALPTIFVGNSHPALDDQVARASMAQEAGAAIELPEDELYQLPALCQLLLEAPVREVLRERCRALSRPNGAVEAAELIARLARAQ